MIQKLTEKIKKTKAPVVVGLDPMLDYIPEHIARKAYQEFGETLEGAAEAVWQFNKEIIDHIWDLIPAVKPQIAMYEQFGLEGKRSCRDRRHQKGRYRLHFQSLRGRASGKSPGRGEILCRF